MTVLISVANSTAVSVITIGGGARTGACWEQKRGKRMVLNQAERERRLIVRPHSKATGPTEIDAVTLGDEAC